MREEHLYLSLADHILNYIRENHLKAGDRLPSERQLAQKYSVSRSSVREAVRILQNKGLVRIEVGSGMYIPENTDQDRFQIALWKVNYREIFETRNVLELHIIRKVCQTVTEAEIRYIEEPLLVMERDYAEGMFVIAHDNQFHNRIRQLCTNATMTQLVENLLVELDAYGEYMPEMKRIWRDTVPYHREMLEAMRRHDCKGAEDAFGKIVEADSRALEMEGLAEERVVS